MHSLAGRRVVASRGQPVRLACSRFPGDLRLWLPGALETKRVLSAAWGREVARPPKKKTAFAVFWMRVVRPSLTPRTVSTAVLNAELSMLILLLAARFIVLAEFVFVTRQCTRFR